MGPTYEEVTLNGAQDIESQSKNQKLKLDYSKDCCYSLALLITGVILFFPLFFNVIYIRSPYEKARKYSFASILLACCYFVVYFVFFNLFVFSYLTRPIYR